jgi:hypothetical protein
VPLVGKAGPAIALLTAKPFRDRAAGVAEEGGLDLAQECWQPGGFCKSGCGAGPSQTGSPRCRTKSCHGLGTQRVAVYRQVVLQP